MYVTVGRGRSCFPSFTPKAMVGIDATRKFLNISSRWTFFFNLSMSNEGLISTPSKAKKEQRHQANTLQLQINKQIEL